MKPLLSVLAIVSMTFAPAAPAAPMESVSMRFQRNSGDALQKSINLSKNFYRTESYQDSYTERVPYQVEETYYESVPYEVDEPYQDTEYYTDQEYLCRNQTRYRRECRTERRCREFGHVLFSNPILSLLVSNYAHAESDGNLPGGGGGVGGGGGSITPPPRENPPPGVGGGGGSLTPPPRPRPPEPRPEPPRPRPEPPPRPEPRPEPPRPRPEPPRPRPEPPRPRPEPPPRPEPRPEPPRPRPEPRPRPPICRDEQVCREVPYNDRVCNWETVTKSRTVTKYRRVTRYRQEQRTRTVTRYRDEQRCCVTKERQVFDRQWQAQVILNFPSLTALIGTEKETFDILLDGNENSPRLTINAIESIFAYQPEIRIVNANLIEVNMNTRAKYSQSDLGRNSLKEIRVVDDGSANLLILNDEGSKNRVQSAYTLRISSLDGKILNEQQWSSDGKNGKFELMLGSLAQAGEVVRVQLAIARQSILLDQNFQFAVDLQLAVDDESQIDLKPYVDPNQTGKFSLAGNGAMTYLQFRDFTNDVRQVKTEYHFVITDTKGQLIADKVFSRQNVSLVDGRLRLGFVQDFGLDSLVAQNLLRSGRTLVINYEAIRNNRKLKPNPYIIKKRVTLSVE